jgi:hypothetical protein
VAVSWSAVQYVTRVIVEVAQETGQSVRTVAGESFALTLWTWGELARIRKEAQVDRMGERTDLAGLVAVAFHKPEDLQKAEFRYLAAAGTLSQMMDATRERMRDQMVAVQRALAARDSTATG